MFEAFFISKVGIDVCDVKIICFTLFLDMAVVDILEWLELMETEGLLYLIECDFLS